MERQVTDPTPSPPLQGRGTPYKPLFATYLRVPLRYVANFFHKRLADRIFFVPLRRNINKIQYEEVIFSISYDVFLL